MKTGTSRSVWLIGAVLCAGALAAPARGDDHGMGDGALRWAEIAGLIQPGNVVGSGTGQVAGGGQPWTTLPGGGASVEVQSGHVEFHVRGLVLAGGNGVGTPDGINQVKGTLVCDTNGSAGNGDSVLVDTPVVALDPQGNADFDGNVSIPGVCASEPDVAFLVRIGAGAAAGRWIANGAVLHR